jgi:hypothetical protein
MDSVQNCLYLSVFYDFKVHMKKDVTGPVVKDIISSCST